jgi:hypothetical protein
MYVVYRNYNEKHSAWDTKKEAEKQVEVLRNYGYENCSWVQVEGLQIKNGHYYV